MRACASAGLVRYQLHVEMSIFSLEGALCSPCGYKHVSTSRNENGIRWLTGRVPGASDVLLNSTHTCAQFLTLSLVVVLRFFLCALDVGHLHVPADFSACCGIQRSERDPPSITILSPACLSSVAGFPSLPLPWPHYSSLAPPELLWQLIISWHKAERQRLQPPHPAAPWARKVTTFTFRAQIGPARCHQAEMQGQQLFPVQPPPLCVPPLALFHSVLLSLSQPLSRLLNPWHPPCSLQRS